MYYWKFAMSNGRYRQRAKAQCTETTATTHVYWSRQAQPMYVYKMISDRRPILQLMFKLQDGGRNRICKRCDHTQMKYQRLPIQLSCSIKEINRYWKHHVHGMCDITFSVRQPSDRHPVSSFGWCRDIDFNTDKSIDLVNTSVRWNLVYLSCILA
jgi:hypothetical protein